MCSGAGFRLDTLCPRRRRLRALARAEHVCSDCQDPRGSLQVKVHLQHPLCPNWPARLCALTWPQRERLEEISTLFFSFSTVLNRTMQPHRNPILNSMNQLSLVKEFTILGPVIVQRFAGCEVTAASPQVPSSSCISNLGSRRSSGCGGSCHGQETARELNSTDTVFRSHNTETVSNSGTAVGQDR